MPFKITDTFVRNHLVSICVGLVILYGSSSVASAETINLITGAPDIQILSVSPAFPIVSTVSGDINGDGLDDVIMRGGYSTTITVVFGKKNFPKLIRFSEKTPPDLVINSLEDTTILSPPMIVADINGDHIGDLLVSVEHGLDVYWGRKNWPSRIDARTHPPDLRIIAKGKPEDAGSAIGLATTGDINKDGINDLLFAHTFTPKLPPDYEHQPKDWTVLTQEIGFVFWGKQSWPQIIDLNKQEADIVITSAQPNPHFHRIRAFSIGDLDGDGFGDIAVGSWDDLRGVLDPPSNALWATAWIIPGRAPLPRRIELSLSPPVNDLLDSKRKNQKSLVFIDPWPQGMFVGGGLAIGDLNADGKDDLVLSMIKKDKDEFHRRLCIIMGSSELLSTLSLPTPEGCSMVTGGASFEQVNPIFTPRPLVGDFNGDGRKDLFLMFGWPDFTFKGIFGRPVFGPSVNMDAEAEVEIRTPIMALGRGGYGLSTAMGDINGDGKADLLIVDAAGGAGPSEKVGTGTVNIVLGKSLKVKLKKLEVE